MADQDRERLGDTGVAMQEQTRTRKPRLYKVLLHNDDYTPMDFVVMVLKQEFRHSDAEAVHIMLAVHRRGVGVAGTFTREIAETKVARVLAIAQHYEYPLQCSMEPE